MLNAHTLGTVRPEPVEGLHCADLGTSGLSFSPELVDPFMVSLSNHLLSEVEGHERNQLFAVHPELVEGLVRFPYNN